MEVSKKIKKMIIFEFIALLFLIGVIVYSIFAIQKSNNNKVSSENGMVMVLDDSKYQELSSMSDGKGLETDGVTYTVTNNNDYTVTYKVVVVPDVHDDNVLKQVRISTDDLYIQNLIELDRMSGGYVITEHTLEPGYTKVHLIKNWYKLDSNEEVLATEIDFDYRLEINE